MAPLVRFKHLVPGGLPPRRATRDAGGTLPVRAIRFCEPVTAASSFGWYVFPPINFQVLFDGVCAVWTYDGAEAWYPLDTAQYPGFAAKFDKAAPHNIRGFSPPFLTMTEDPAILQIWTGLIVRTAPDWSLLLRSVANLPHSPGYQQLEGIIETDHWGGPLFHNIHLVQTGVPVQFSTYRPFLQVQPIHRAHYADTFLDNATVETGLQSLTPDDWDAYHEAIVVPKEPLHKPAAMIVI